MRHNWILQLNIPSVWRWHFLATIESTWANCQKRLARTLGEVWQELSRSHPQPCIQKPDRLTRENGLKKKGSIFIPRTIVVHQQQTTGVKLREINYDAHCRTDICVTVAAIFSDTRCISGGNCRKGLSLHLPYTMYQWHFWYRWHNSSFFMKHFRHNE